MNERPCLVFDSNCLASYLLLPDSIPSQAVGAGIQNGRFIASDETLEELTDVLARPKFDRYISLSKRKTFLRKFG